MVLTQSLKLSYLGVFIYSNGHEAYIEQVVYSLADVIHVHMMSSISLLPLEKISVKFH
jgi:hypothetical protein